MKASELRIGNYLLHDGIFRQVSSLHNDNTLRFKDGDSSIGCFKATISTIKPIELTEEILLKCGFKELENQPRKWFKIKTKKRYVSLEICFSSKRIVLNNGYDFVDLLYIKHLHQLQNLYFALTNEELIINL